MSTTTVRAPKRKRLLLALKDARAEMVRCAAAMCCRAVHMNEDDRTDAEQALVWQLWDDLVRSVDALLRALAEAVEAGAVRPGPGFAQAGRTPENGSPEASG